MKFIIVLILFSLAEPAFGGGTGLCWDIRVKAHVPCGSNPTSSGGSSGGGFDAEAYRRAIEARRLKRMQRQKQLNSAAQKALDKARREKNNFDSLVRRSLRTPYSGKNSNQLVSHGGSWAIPSNTKADFSVSEVDHPIEIDLFSLCFSGLSPQEGVGVDVDGLKRCLSHPLVNTTQIKNAFDKKKFDQFLKVVDKIPFVSQIAGFRKPWIYAVKMAYLWEAAWIAKISDELMPIEGFSAKSVVKEEFRKVHSEMGKDLLDTGLEKVIGSSGRAFFGQGSKIKNSFWLSDPVVEIATTPIKDLINSEKFDDALIKLKSDQWNNSKSLFNGLE